jgi:hypothetical protein
VFCSGKCECALFGEYVDDLNKKFGKGHDNQPVVIIQFAKVKIFRGFFFLIVNLLIHVFVLGTYKLMFGMNDLYR